VLDSTFNQDVKRAKAILRMIKKIAPDIHFHFEVRSEYIDREMAALFSQITCSLQIGLQSSDPLVLKQVGRSFAKDDFKTRINLLNESGAVFGFDLMYGLPGDNLQGFCESLDFALSLYPNHLDIFPLAVLPGTALRSRSSSIGLTHLLEPPYTLITSPAFTITEMHRAQQVASACDIFYTRGRAVAWFNGVMDVLGLKPSDFFQSFADMLVIRSGTDFNESDFMR
jgi:radical SAM superfamily enzyme